ncbi:MAG TPA: hypothetical protein VM900_05540, partial [Sphingomonas sp.]|nr:hypothetical protein [Sphingomonas sp.]
GTIVAALWQRARSAWLPTIAAAGLLAGWAVGAPETLVVPAALAAMLLALAIHTAPSCRTGSGIHPSPASTAIGSAARWTSGRARGDGEALVSRALHRLGEISYATYLGHFLLWKAFKLAVVENPAAVPLAQIALYLALVLIASLALYRWVEKPAQRWINDLPIRPSLPRVPRRAR